MENLKSKWKILDKNGKFEIKVENLRSKWKNETKRVKTDTIAEKFEIKMEEEMLTWLAKFLFYTPETCLRKHTRKIKCF